MQINSPEVIFDSSIKFSKVSLKDTRFDIPRGLTKKEYTKLLRETQNEINNLIIKIRELGPDDGLLLDLTREDYVTKKTKLKALIKNNTQFKELSIEEARKYPIDLLLEFNNTGFIRCLWHDEKTPSLKYDRGRNKVHCFAGCGDFDSIDVYQKLNNVTLPKALEYLCQKK